MCRCQRTLRFIRRTAFRPSGFQTAKSFTEVVGLTGFEPVTLRLSSACSNQLSYRPKESHIGPMVELRRVELLTYSLQSYRSTN